VAYEYTEDYADKYNPEVNKLYGGIVSFFPNLKGIKKRLINYGMSQFRFDLFADDLVPIDDVTQNFSIAGDFISQKNFSNVLLLYDGLAASPRLLDWDGVSVNEAKVKRRKVTNILWLYNEVMSLTTTGLFPGQKNLQTEIFSFVDGAFNDNLEWSKTLNIDCNRKEYDIYDVVTVNYQGQKKQALISYVKYNYESSTVELKAKIFN
jgi:hypothetical protein